MAGTDAMNIHVARQPILDANRNIVAYELLARTGESNSFSGDPNIASVTAIETTMLGFGLPMLIGKADGFFNASRELLTSQRWKALPSGRSVLEVLETVEPDGDIVAACAAAKTAGYRIALDDFVFRPEYEALLPHVDIIKVDFMSTPADERAAVAERYRSRGIVMLAEKIETYQDFHEAVAAGYTLFQGYFFCRPEMVATKDIPPSRLSLIRLIGEVNRPELDMTSLERVISHDVALSVRLLRYLRSAALGWRHNVETIEQGLRTLGERQARQWASIVALNLMGDEKPAALMQATLLRAYFCEELATMLGMPTRQSEFFLTGLLSTLDAVLDRPMPTILGQMSLGGEAHAALMGENIVLRDCLRAVAAYERADWGAVDRFAARNDLDPSGVAEAYQRSLGRIADGAFAA
ncbi:MAG: HDOD domain-containing protein [Gemmatimonadota bacterium]